MKNKIILLLSILLITILIISTQKYLGPILISKHIDMTNDNYAASGKSSRRKITIIPVFSAKTNEPFTDNFSTNTTIEEVGYIDETKNTAWWLSSGAYFYNNNGTGNTIIGELPAINPWRVAFSLSNAIDTDNGYHPQNIFRMINVNQWSNPQQEIYFRIKKINSSNSPNRNASNGVLFMSRYQDAANLYYTGIRVDGTAVIKKKTKNTYYTLAQKNLFSDGSSYNRATDKQNFIPLNTWIGIKSEVITKPNNTVNIKLFVDKEGKGLWTLAAEATDDGSTYGGQNILGAGHTGLRSDFMDVEFKNYRVMNL